MELQIFNNPEFGNIRVTGSPDDPLFCLADICRAVDLDPSAVMRRLDKGVISSHPLSTAGGTQMANFVNEDGLYDVILDSRKPEAKRFRKWLTSEVLPSIRKYGVYATEEFAAKALEDPAWASQIFAQLAKHRADNQKLLAENAALNAKCAELQVKADYHDIIFNCPDTVKVSVIAKDYGYSARAFNKLLHKLGIQFRQGDIWFLYQCYANLGWTKSKTYYYTNSNGEHCANVINCWTQKGRLALYDLLKAHNIRPLIEK